MRNATNNPTRGSVVALVLLLCIVGWVAYSGWQGWPGRWGILARIVSAAWVCVLVYTLGSAGVARILGGDVEEVRLGLGTQVAAFTWNDTTGSLGWLPLGGFVKLRGMEASENASPSPFNRLPLLSRVLIQASGSLVTFAFACLLLGVAAAFAAFEATYGQMFSVCVYPLTQGQATLAHTFDVARTVSWATLLGLVGAKFAAFNLLPLPPLTGGSLLLEFARPRWEEQKQQMTGAGLFVLLLLYLLYCVALLRFLF